MTQYIGDKDIKVDFNDILITPAITTDISSRGEVNPFKENGLLPLFTAPMDTVVDNTNSDLFMEHKLNICLPRGEKRTQREMFQSYSLKQFNETFIDNSRLVNESDLPVYALIDTANGHIKDLVDSTKAAKHFYGDKMVLMVGNIANPHTYKLLSNVGADYIRVGIGNGNGCLTTQQLGIGYPMASLIRECYYSSLSLENPAKIVADGGMKEYSDIIKALALGADYVMLGSILNKCAESCGQSYLKGEGRPVPISTAEAINHFKRGDLGESTIIKEFRGMSTKEVQKKWGNEVLKTSEGVVRYRPVEYTLEQWVDNFESYLRSAMSYVNARTLEEFINNSEFINITNNAYNRFKK
jgi:IMP dehydrogenase/GMP reductase